jgi:hypothetical protein
MPSGLSFEDLFAQIDRVPIRCRKCKAFFSMEEGHRKNRELGLPSGLLTCPKCETVYECDVTTQGVILRADVTKKHGRRSKKIDKGAGSKLVKRIEKSASKKSSELPRKATPKTDASKPPWLLRNGRPSTWTIVGYLAVVIGVLSAVLMTITTDSETGERYAPISILNMVITCSLPLVIVGAGSLWVARWRKRIDRGQPAPAKLGLAVTGVVLLTMAVLVAAMMVSIIIDPEIGGTYLFGSAFADTLCCPSVFALPGCILLAIRSMILRRQMPQQQKDIHSEEAVSKKAPKSSDQTKIQEKNSGSRKRKPVQTNLGELDLIQLESIANGDSPVTVLVQQANAPGMEGMKTATITPKIARQALASRRHSDKADTLASEGNFKNALSEYKKAIEKAPYDDDVVYRSIGGVLIQLGDYRQAIRYLTMAVDINPHDTIASQNLAYAKSKAGGT